MACTMYYRPDFNSQPFEIELPTLTRKERLHLDWEMPCADGWAPKEFELSAEEGRDYRDVCPIQGVFIGGNHWMRVAVDRTL